MFLKNYVFSLHLSISFISCKEHKDDSIYKFGAQFNAFQIHEKEILILITNIIRFLKQNLRINRTSKLMSWLLISSPVWDKLQITLLFQSIVIFAGWLTLNRFDWMDGWRMNNIKISIFPTRYGKWKPEWMQNTSVKPYDHDLTQA
jgi:hypothetical protein